MINQIIFLREHEGLSQEKFAKRLGLSRNFINQAENGKKNLSDRTVNDICREFNINEDWLRYGKEPMYKPTEDKLSTYMAQIAIGEDDFIKDLIEIYMELDQTSKDTLKIIANRMADKKNKREQK